MIYYLKNSSLTFLYKLQADASSSSSNSSVHTSSLTSPLYINSIRASNSWPLTSFRKTIGCLHGLVWKSVWPTKQVSQDERNWTSQDAAAHHLHHMIFNQGCSSPLYFQYAIYVFITHATIYICKLEILYILFLYRMPLFWLYANVFYCSHIRTYIYSPVSFMYGTKGHSLLPQSAKASTHLEIRWTCREDNLVCWERLSITSQGNINKSILWRRACQTLLVDQMSKFYQQPE